MTRHIILWTLKEMTEAEKARVKAEIKAGLEGLAGQIPGLVSIRVETRRLPSLERRPHAGFQLREPGRPLRLTPPTRPHVAVAGRQGPPLHGRAQLSRL